jgi:hypothetical protein
VLRLLEDEKEMSLYERYSFAFSRAKLDRMDAAFAQLAALSGRQDRAALVVRDIVTELRELRGRVRELEALARSRISPE